MVTGKLRTVLWILGSLATLWLVLGLLSLPAMGGMMQGGGMEMGGMMLMMAMGAAALIVLLGMVGVFLYLLVDARRSRRARGTPS